MVLRNQTFYEDAEKLVQIKGKKTLKKKIWKTLAILVFLGVLLFLISIISGIITIENIYDKSKNQPNLPSDKSLDTELKIYRNDILKEKNKLIFDRKKRHFPSIVNKMRKNRHKRNAPNYERFNSSELESFEISYFDLKSRIRDKRDQLELNELEDNYNRCKRTLNDQNCDSIFIKMYNLAKEINDRIDGISKLLKEKDSGYTEKKEISKDKTITKKYGDLDLKKIEMSGIFLEKNSTVTHKDNHEVPTQKNITTKFSTMKLIEDDSQIKLNKTENFGQTNIFLGNFTIYISTFYDNHKNQSNLSSNKKSLLESHELIIDRKKRYISSLINETETNRPKRNASNYEKFNSSELDPIEISYFDLKSKIRDKRDQLELNKLEENYRRCKRTVNDENCDSIFIKMYKLAREINDRIDQISKLLKESESYYNNQANNSEVGTVKSIEKGPLKFSMLPEDTTEFIKRTTGTTETFDHISKENELDIDDPLRIKYDKDPLKAPSTPLVLVAPQIHEDLQLKPDIARSNIHSDHDETFEAWYKKLVQANSHLPYTQVVVTKKPETKSDLGEPKEWDPELIKLFEAWYKKQMKNLTKISTTTLKPNTKTALKADVAHKTDLENLPFVAASGPFISLCEDLVRQNFDKNKHQLSTGSGPDNLSGTFTHEPNHQFTGRAPGFPVTGETMKATAQYVFNPNFGGMPFCFYASPDNLKLLNQNQQSSLYGPTNIQGMPDFGLIDPRSRNIGGMFFVPQNMYGNTQAPTSISPYSTYTASGLHPFNAKQNFNQQQQPMFCAYMLNNNNGQFGPQITAPGSIAGAFNFRMRNLDNETHEDEVSSEKKYPNIPSNTDIIYASYANEKARADLKHTNCKSDSIACFSNEQCIPKSKWCDSVVDCRDASDETACSCKSRLDENRICDGYADCPMAEDEMGCFGCDKLMFSCYHNFEEYARNGKSTVAMCYSNINKCDGISDCLNGNDEMNCNLIVSGLGNQLAYQKSSAEGFLHRNHKGRWYPVCENSRTWAHEACENEIGTLDSEPYIDEIPIYMGGPSIRQGKYSEIHFTDNCNNTAYVKCPQIKCGRNKNLAKLWRPGRTKRTNNETEIEEIMRKKRFEDDERVVGGELCKPMKWPFIVAIYRNGKFLCGGVIFSDKWVITAAHCVINFKKHYYEIYSGLLRRSSFSSTIQISKVLYVFPHPKYEKQTMKNDLALIYLETSLKFNRWVRPICLPSKDKVSDNKYWTNGPSEGTICTAVGWGATREHGLGSDHLREVQIPILSKCKSKIDVEANDICAGEPTGGRDACQGDSGGPLFCRSIKDPTEWYLAGIVSHGEGCARPNEPGVYTRVALYLNWIESYSSQKLVTKPKLTPLRTCPGHKCVWGGERCIQPFKRCDRIVDCLGGEDEIGCEYPHFSDEVGNIKNLTNLDYEDSIEDTEALYTDSFIANTLSSESDSNENVNSTPISNESITEHVTEELKPENYTTPVDSISVRNKSFEPIPVFTTESLKTTYLKDVHTDPNTTTEILKWNTTTNIPSTATPSSKSTTDKNIFLDTTVDPIEKSITNTPANEDKSTINKWKSASESIENQTNISISSTETSTNPSTSTASPKSVNSSSVPSITKSVDLMKSTTENNEYNLTFNENFTTIAPTASPKSVNNSSVPSTTKSVHLMKSTTEYYVNNFTFNENFTTIAPTVKLSSTNIYVSTESLKEFTTLFNERSERFNEGKVEPDGKTEKNFLAENFSITTDNIVLSTTSRDGILTHFKGNPSEHRVLNKSTAINSKELRSENTKPAQTTTEILKLTEVTSQKPISSSEKNPVNIETTTEIFDNASSIDLKTFNYTTPEFRSEEFSTIFNFQTSTETISNVTGNDNISLLEITSKKPGDIYDHFKLLADTNLNIGNGTTNTTPKEIPESPEIQNSTEFDQNESDIKTRIYNSSTPSLLDTPISANSSTTEINAFTEFDQIYSSHTESDIETRIYNSSTPSSLDWPISANSSTTEINALDSTMKSVLTTTVIKLKADNYTEESTTADNSETNTEQLFEFITIDGNIKEEKITNETKPLAPYKLFTSTEKPLKHENENKKHRRNNKFFCKNIFQSIDISNYCDKIIDCEDGTDEDNCTCKDYLKGTLNILICDGKADCEDLTDEENCGNCTSNEFLCPLSQRCIEISKRCDDTIDCQFKEDEMDCYALTNGKTVFLDGNKRPNLHDFGIFSRNKNGVWHIVCSDELNALMKISTNPPAEEICSILGFKGFKNFSVTSILHNHTILPSIIIDDNNTTAKIRRKAKRELIQNISNDCEAIFVECNPHSNNHEPIQIIQNQNTKFIFHDKNQPIINKNDESNALKPNSTLSITTEIEDLVKPINDISKNHTGEIIEHYSWSVDIFNNGKLKCHGILLDKYWVAVSETCCKHIRLKEDYAVAVFGGQINRNLHSKGPHQQIQRIDCLQQILNSNIMLLHLEYPVHFTRYVLPTFLPDMEKEPHDSRQSYECMIVAHKHNNKIISIKVKELFDESICKTSNFNKKNINICLESIDKHIDSLCQQDKNSTATVLCRQDNSGWYPRSFFEISSENCDFRTPFIVEEIYKIHDDIQTIIENHKCGSSTYFKPMCTTYRCPLGKCLNSQQICDGKMDCHDGSDEAQELCHKKECPPTDLKCKNGNCVSKSKFCDQIDDCGDLTDEPTICSCYTYLKASDPGKICDGIRNCWDKSDENPAFCDCTPDRFQCGRTDECVSRDVICDQQYDCPNGEDEQFCYGLEYPSLPYINNDGYGQVIAQSYGVWHTKCFPKNHTLTNTEVIEICKKVGYQSNDNVQYRLIEDNEINDMVSHQFENNSDGVKVGLFEKYLSPTKARVINKFSPLRLNQHLTFLIKPSRPLTQLEKWNDDDLEKCNRLEIKCY